MSLTNPVISDLIAAAYERDRHAEVKKVHMRSDAPRGIERTARAFVAMARGAELLGVQLPIHAGRRPRPEAEAPTGNRSLVPAGSSSDGQPY